MERKILALLLAAVFSAFAEPADGGTSFAAEEFKTFVDSGELPGIIAVFQKGNLMESACLGWADAEKKRPIAMDQIFMQCSQTKGFCGVTIAILVEEGKIALDDPISKYLPEFGNLKVSVKDKNGKETLVPAVNIPTIRMAMNHTAGFLMEIPEKLAKGWPSVTLRDSARIIAAKPLLFEPGTKASYANTGIDVCAAIAEIVTGKDWDVFLRERVFNPLGMKDATFNPTEKQLSNMICLYNVQRGKKAVFRAAHSIMPLPHNGPDIHPAAGAGLWITANDQLKFYRMLMNLGKGDNGVRILKEETVKNLLAKSSRPEGMEKYSLGLWVDDNGEMGHGGAWGSKCTVNWKKKQLELRVVQVFPGRLPAWDDAWKRAAGKFFGTPAANSGADSYTGRIR